jgi:hypothetical protein
MRRRRVALATVVGAMAAVWPHAVRAVDREACFSSAESAQQLRTQGKLRSARDALILCAQTGCPAAVQKDCVRWLGEVRDAVPTVVFTAHDGRGNDLADVSVTVDGESVATALDGRPIDVDPGPHVLHYERTGSKRVDKSIVVAAGQKLREIAVEMEADAAALPEGTVARRAPIPVASIVLGGVGVVALTSMTYFWVSGRSAFSELEATCSPMCNPATVDPVRAKLVVGDVSMGIALVSLGLGTWFFLSRPSAASPAPTVGVAPTPHGGVAALKLVF